LAHDVPPGSSGLQGLPVKRASSPRSSGSDSGVQFVNDLALAGNLNEAGNQKRFVPIFLNGDLGLTNFYLLLYY
jgi:hypothetical protein